MPVFYPPQGNNNGLANVATILGLWDKFAGPTSKAHKLAMENATEENTRANTRASQNTAAHILAMTATQAQLDASKMQLDTAKATAKHGTDLNAVSTFPQAEGVEKTLADLGDLPFVGGALKQMSAATPGMFDKARETRFADLNEAFKKMAIGDSPVAVGGPRHDANRRVRLGEPGATVQIGQNGEQSTNFPPEIGAPVEQRDEFDDVIGWWNTAGHFTPKPAGPKRSEAQMKAQTFVGSMSKSNARLAEAEARGYDPSEAVPTLNIWKSPERQKYEADAGVWVMSVLRMESGGAITPEEIVSYRSYFMPSVTDSKEMVEHKAGLRAEKEQAIRDGYELGRSAGTWDGSKGIGSKVGPRPDPKAPGGPAAPGATGSAGQVPDAAAARAAHAAGAKGVTLPDGRFAPFAQPAPGGTVTPPASAGATVPNVPPPVTAPVVAPTLTEQVDSAFKRVNTSEQTRHNAQQVEDEVAAKIKMTAATPPDKWPAGLAERVGAQHDQLNAKLAEAESGLKKIQEPNERSLGENMAKFGPLNAKLSLQRDAALDGLAALEKNPYLAWPEKLNEYRNQREKKPLPALPLPLGVSRPITPRGARLYGTHEAPPGVTLPDMGREMRR